MKRLVALFLAIVMLCSLVACGSETNNEESELIIENTSISTEANGAALPGNEYDRGIWYGFMPDDLAGADPSKVITWKQYCTMLGNMIQRYDSEAYPEWQKMTADMPETTMKRDGAMLALLFAGKAIGMDEFNAWCWPSEFDWGSQCSWDYPLDWDKPMMFMGNQEENCIWPAILYSFGFRASSVSGSFLMDTIEGSPSLDKDFTLDMAMRSVVRIYESDEDIAYAYANAMLEQVKETPEGKKIISAAEERKQAILTSKTNIVKSDTFIQGKTYTGTAYYISNSGDDNSNGTSPENAWATIAPLSSRKLSYGDAVFFQRDGIWREFMLPDNLRNTEGITYSSYGEGEKPRLYGSPENGAGAEKWELWYESEEGKKIWRYHTQLPDTSVIVMNDGDTYAKRDVPYWNGSEYVTVNDFSRTYLCEEQLDDMEFFPYLVYPEDAYDPNHIYIADHIGGVNTLLTGELYLRCDAGNPGELYNSIEFSTAHDIADGIASYTTVDNLNISYSRSLVSGQANSLYVQNCESGWCGGHVSYYTEEDEPFGADMGYFWMDGGCLNISGVGSRNCNNYAHHAYQEGPTLETFSGSNDCTDVVIEGNLIEYCLMGMLLINWDNEYDPSHVFSQVYMQDNMVLYSGFENFYNVDTFELPLESNTGGWHGTRGLRVIDTHAFGTNMQQNPHDGTVMVSGNTFAFSGSQLIENRGHNEEYSYIFDGNTYAQLPGMVWLTWMTYPHYDAQVYESVCDPEEAIIEIMRDENATIISFD